MKKLLYIALILTFSVSHSQNETNETNYLKGTLFEYNIRENNLKTLNQNLEIFPDIIDLNMNNFKNNSEGKFSLNSSNKNYFLNELAKSEESIFKSKDLKSDNNFKKNSSLVTNAKQKFITKVIIKKMNQEIIDYILTNEALAYGDRNIDLYRNYSKLHNKLILDYALNSEIELQIGNDIYPYLNKTLKTEIDKTLQNSLNLLAINF